MTCRNKRPWRLAINHNITSDWLACGHNIFHRCVLMFVLLVTATRRMFCSLKYLFQRGRKPSLRCAQNLTIPVFFLFQIAIWREGRLAAWREVSLCMSYITTQDTKGTKVWWHSEPAVCTGCIICSCRRWFTPKHYVQIWKTAKVFFVITTGTNIDADALNDFWSLTD